MAAVEDRALCNSVRVGIFRRNKSNDPASDAAAPSAPPEGQAEYDPTGRDYSHIDSREKAAAEVAAGRLTEVLLFAEIFGGPRSPENTVPVPLGIDQVKDMIDGTIMRFAQDGLIDNFEARPEYSGNSVVPTRIAIECTSSDPSKGSFNPVIEIWS